MSEQYGSDHDRSNGPNKKARFWVDILSVSILTVLVLAMATAAMMGNVPVFFGLFFLTVIGSVAFHFRTRPWKLLKRTAGFVLFVSIFVGAVFYFGSLFDALLHTLIIFVTGTVAMVVWKARHPFELIGSALLLGGWLIFVLVPMSARWLPNGTASLPFPLYLPIAALADGEGNVYVVEDGFRRIFKYSRTGEVLKTWSAGSNPIHNMRMTDGLALEFCVTGGILVFDLDGNFLSHRDRSFKEPSCDELFPGGLATGGSPEFPVRIRRAGILSHIVELKEKEGWREIDGPHTVFLHMLHFFGGLPMIALGILMMDAGRRAAQYHADQEVALHGPRVKPEGDD